MEVIHSGVVKEKIHTPASNVVDPGMEWNSYEGDWEYNPSRIVENEATWELYVLEHDTGDTHFLNVSRKEYYLVNVGDTFVWTTNEWMSNEEQAAQRDYPVESE